MTRPTSDPTSRQTARPTADPTSGPRTRSLKEIEASLVVRAWKDSAFRQRLLENPVEVFKEQLGDFAIDWTNLQVRVVEETADTIYMVLPSRPEWLPTDDQLEDMIINAAYRCPCNPERSMSLGGGRSVDQDCSVTFSRFCDSFDEEPSGSEEVQTG